MTESRDAIRSFADSAGAAMISQGFPRVPARILMALTAADDGSLSAIELRELLGLSAAAVSQAAAYLQQVGFVQTQTVPGTRRHRYHLSVDHWYAGGQLTGAYARTASGLEHAGRALPEGSAGRRRADDLADFLAFCAREIPSLYERWLQQRG